MNLKTTLIAALAAATMLTTAGAAFAAEDGVTLRSVNMREGPSTYEDVIRRLKKGTFVSIEECSKGWCEIYYDHDYGFVSSKYLALVEDDDDDDDDDYDDKPDVKFCVGGNNGYGFGKLCVEN